MNQSVPFDNGFNDRQRLSELREVLFELHRLLLGQLRAKYESEQGRVSPQEFFRLLLHSPQFQWIRPLSGLLSETDEVLDDEDAEAGAYADVLRKIELLFRFSPQETDFSTAYKEMLQNCPDVAACHGEVRHLLPKRGPTLS